MITRARASIARLWEPGFVFAVVALVSFISALCIWFYPSVQDFMASNTMWNGIKRFGEEFHADYVDSLGDLPRLPERAILVSIPYLPYSDEQLAQLRGFVGGGGTMLLMDDFGYGNSILACLDMDARISGKPLLDPLFCYKNQWMPRIVDFAPEMRATGIELLLLNHASILTNVEPGQVLAWSSKASFLDADENGSMSSGDPQGPFPVAARLGYGKGKIILVSDPSIVINAMVAQEDNYRFLRSAMNLDSGQMSVLVDRSHLPETPLDVSKSRLTDVRNAVASPYGIMGILAAVFLVTYRYAPKKG